MHLHINSYLCSACILVLVPGVAPVGSTDPDQRSIIVSWMMLDCQDRRGIITMYEVHYTSSDFDENVDLTVNTTNGDEMSLIVSELEEFTNYTIEVRAYTAVGPGPYSDPMDVQTLPDRKYIVCRYQMFGCVWVYVCTCICL